MKREKEGGFTLIELIFVLVIAFVLLYSQAISTHSPRASLIAAVRALNLELNFHAVESFVIGHIDRWSQMNADQQTVDEEISRGLTTRLQALDDADLSAVESVADQNRNIKSALPKLDRGASASGFIKGGEPKAESDKVANSIYVVVTQGNVDNYNVTVKALNGDKVISKTTVLSHK